MVMVVNSTVNTSACIALRNSQVAVFVLSYCIFVVASLVILFLLCLVQKRVRLWKDCCWGHMALPVPMDFLISPRYRLPYILVFSVLANELFTDLSNTGTPGALKSKVYLNIVYKILILPFIVVTFLGLKFFPLLACVEASRLFFGHCLGFVYSVLWLADSLTEIVYQYYSQICVCTAQLCSETSSSPWQLAVFILQQLPKILIIVSVILWYLYSIVKGCIATLQKQAENSTSPEIKEYHLSRVKKLFSKSLPSNVTRGRLTKRLLKIFFYFFPYSKYHKLPLPLLCVVAAMSMFLYQLSLPLAVFGFTYTRTLSDFYHKTLKGPLNLSAATDDLLASLLVGVPVVFVVAPFVSLLLCIFLVFHMLASISKKLKLYARSGFMGEKMPSKLSRVPSAWRYLGAQFGFFVCAWFIYLLVTLLLGFAIIAIIYTLKYLTSSVINFALIIFIPLAWSKIIFYLQFLLCKFIFLENSKGRFISITNRRLFNWFAYVLFLYNGIAGFISAIIRVFLTALVSLVLLFRLDSVVMAKGFEFLDNGHRAFLGFYYLYYSYNNAVMHTFIYLLRKRHVQREHREDRRDMQDESLSSPLLPNFANPRVLEEVSTCNQSCRNRWLVAYTLIRNPSLQPLTASNIARARREELTTPLSGDSVEVISPEMQKREGVIVTFDVSTNRIV